MARIRSIKPGFCTSEAIAALSIPCELHFAKLWTYCDDEGRGVDNPRLIKAACWPLRDEVTRDEIEQWQAELAEHRRIIRYEVNGKRFFQVLNWSEHQKPQHPKASEIPAPDSENAHEVSPDPENLESSSSENAHEASPEKSPVVGEGEGVGEVDGAVSPDDTERTFENFWEIYPRRSGRRLNRKEALAIWKRLSKAKREQAIAGARVYAAEVDRGEILAKDPDRWLRGEKWDEWLKPAVHSVRKNYGEKFGAPESDEPTDVPCEHSDPMCIDCRRENVRRLSELTRGVGADA